MENAIAIVGMSCRFAGAPGPNALWDAVIARESKLSVLGPDAEIPFGQKNVFNRPYPVRLGQLGDLYSCVPAMQNFPRQVNAGENQDLYFATQLAFDALVDAGLRPHSPTPILGSVRLGYHPPFNSSTINWLEHTAFLDQTIDVIRRFFPQAPEEAMDLVRARLDESLPSANAASFLLGSGYRFVSWIARECAFSGVATIVDAGNLSGAATVMDAMDDLNSRRVDISLAGAMTPPLSRAYLEGLSGAVEFSEESVYHPYSATSGGTIPGEGGAFFVLKRREDALRDHDRIYALIRSVAIGHNPPDDPSAILTTAVERAQVPVRSISLIEGDGSGIALTERREIAAIQRLWGEHRPGGELVGLTSVKGNIGHTLTASVAAGVVKTALALYHRVLPPQLTPLKLSDELSSLASSVYPITEPRPWIAASGANPRRAAVLGANFDSPDPVAGAASEGRAAVLILEEEPESRA